MIWRFQSSTSSDGRRPHGRSVFACFRAAVAQTYSSRGGRIVLFGSSARGDARPDSDYDIGLFLTELYSFDREPQALTEIETDILMATGAVVNALPPVAYAGRQGGLDE